jgi:ComF family protein
MALCPACAAGDGPAYLDGLRAACVYEGAARQAILALKFRGQRRLAQPLADLLAAGYAREGLVADLIVPVRLHRGRRRQRGFDQAELLARALGDRLDLGVRADLLVRHRATAPQTTLPRDQRRANVAGAFALASPAATQCLAGRRLVLVDDVSTTGSTLDAAAAALREANPETIWGLAVARPGLHPQDDAPDARTAARTTRGAWRSRTRG